MGMAIPDEATGNYTLMPLWIWVYCLVWWLIQVASPSSSLISLLTSDDTREAHSFLESDQLLT